MKFLRNLLIIVALIWVGVFEGCSDSSGDDENAETLSGYFWFSCEFDTSITCEILDDDGYQFTTDGNIYEIEEAGQGVLPECGESNCFRADNPSITVDRELIGTYSIDGDSITITLEGCTETLFWNISDVGSNIFEIYPSCLIIVNSLRNVKRYTGEVFLNEN